MLDAESRLSQIWFFPLVDRCLFTRIVAHILCLQCSFQARVCLILFAAGINRRNSLYLR